MAAGWRAFDRGSAGGLRLGAPQADGRSAGARRVRGPGVVGDAVAHLGRALGYGAVGVLVGAFQGAGDGASWVLVTGGSWSEAAWIGAAAGAGLGFLIRFVTGLAKAGSGFGAEPAAPPRCPSAVAAPTAHAEDYIETEHTN